VLRAPRPWHHETRLPEVLGRDGGIALDSLVIVSKQDVDESRAEALATALLTRE
jgi:hypothetical protein